MRFERRLRQLEIAKRTRDTPFKVVWDDEATEEGPWGRCLLADRHGLACRVGRSGRHVVRLSWE